MIRRVAPPWTSERIPGGYVVKDATGQSLAYVYARETKAEADTAKVLTMDEAAVVAEADKVGRRIWDQVKAAGPITVPRLPRPK